MQTVHSRETICVKEEVARMGESESRYLVKPRLFKEQKGSGNKLEREGLHQTKGLLKTRYGVWILLCNGQVILRLEGED